MVPTVEPVRVSASIGLGRLRDPEIGQVGVVLAADLAQEDVGGLDVAVDEPGGLVDGIECSGQLLADGDGALRRQAPGGVEDLAQVGAVDPLHDQVEAAVLVADVIDGDDVGVVDGGRELRLAQEAFTVFGLGGDLVLDHLQRDVAVERPLARLVDDTHASGARDLDDLEVAELVSCLQFLCHGVPFLTPFGGCASADYSYNCLTVKRRQSVQPTSVRATMPA